MLSTTHAVFHGLQDNIKDILKDLPDDVDPVLKNGLVEAHRKLSDYFAKFDKSDYYHWAAHMFLAMPFTQYLTLPAVLDPRISYTMLLEDYKEDLELHAALEVAKANLESHFDIFYSTPTPSSLSSNTLLDNQQSPRKNFASRYTKKRGSTTMERYELREYFRQTSEPACFDTTDPLEWWHTRRETFPNLYRLVHDILCIPGKLIFFALA